MPTDETRHLLRAFGVAVTTFEDAIRDKASSEVLHETEADARARLEQVTALVERLLASAAAASRL
jgi:hypothetical protein